VWLGTISYGLYLWHEIFLKLAPGGRPISTRGHVLAVTLGFAAASVSYYGMERPILRLKRRYERAATTDDVLETAPMPVVLPPLPERSGRSAVRPRVTPLQPSDNVRARPPALMKPSA
jgi:peptidoglycan/LPS O-acetylase OafA/YrhL